MGGGSVGILGDQNYQMRPGSDGVRDLVTKTGLTQRGKYNTRWGLGGLPRDWMDEKLSDHRCPDILA